MGKLTDVVTGILTDATDSSRLSIPMDEQLQRRLAHSAKAVGISVPDFVEGCLKIQLSDSTDVWRAHPDTMDLRREIVGNAIFETDQELVFEMCNRQGVSKPRLVVRTTLPRALWVKGDSLGDTYRAWNSLYGHLRRAIEDDTRLEIRRLVIDRSERSEQQVARDADFSQYLTGNAEGRVEVKYLTIDDIHLHSGQQSDSEYLNDFNIYDDLAVSFTTETCFGQPYRGVLSRARYDVKYWTDRFDDLWRTEK